MRSILLCLLITVFFFVAKSQTVTNVTSQQEGNRIKINYQLSNLSTSQIVTVNLYYSVNNNPFSGPLQKVSGDVGYTVHGNGNKTIFWDVLSEIGSLEGNTAFKVEVIPQNKPLYQQFTSDGFTYEVTSCKLTGNQLVIEAIFTNLSDDVRRYLTCNDDIKINDDKGNQFMCSHYYVSQIKIENEQYREIDFVKNIPVKISFAFTGVDNSCRSISLLDVKIRETCASCKISNRLQFRDIAILK